MHIAPFCCIESPVCRRDWSRHLAHTCLDTTDQDIARVFSSRVCSTSTPRTDRGLTVVIGQELATNFKISRRQPIRSNSAGAIRYFSRVQGLEAGLRELKEIEVGREESDSRSLARVLLTAYRCFVETTRNRVLKIEDSRELRNYKVWCATVKRYCIISALVKFAKR